MKKTCLAFGMAVIMVMALFSNEQFTYGLLQFLTVESCHMYLAKFRKSDAALRVDCVL